MFCWNVRSSAERSGEGQPSNYVSALVYASSLKAVAIYIYIYEPTHTPVACMYKYRYILTQGERIAFVPNMFPDI